MDALVNCTLYSGRDVLTEHAVLIAEGRIRDVVRTSDVPPDAKRLDLAGDALAPGFIDVQVNGGGGVLFNDAPTAKTIARIGEAHRAFGTTGFLPTFITGPRADMAKAIDAARDAIISGVPGVLGIHLEGPHLNPEKRAVHDARYIREVGQDDVALLCSLGNGVTVVTLAPERVPKGTISELSRRGVRVSAGHTAATGETFKAAVDEGLAGVTHLFNAMTPLSSREPGAVGAALVDPHLWCGIIADGHHVHFDNVRIAWRAKPVAKLFLVTDAMPPVGTDIAAFELGSQHITVKDGRCVTAEGRLAGSTLTMAGAVDNCVRRVGIPLDEALRMASTYPADFLGLSGELGHIAAGFRANLVRFDAGTLEIKATWIDGQVAQHGAHR